jgi:hypothetical protein
MTDLDTAFQQCLDGELGFVNTMPTVNIPTFRCFIRKRRTRASCFESDISDTDIRTNVVTGGLEDRRDFAASDG